MAEHMEYDRKETETLPNSLYIKIKSTVQTK